MISYGKHFIDRGDIREVLKVLKSDNLTQGPKVEKFEYNLKKKLNAKYALAVSSGTAALHLIGLSLGWKKNDIILASPITFVSSINSAIYCGATPDFVDIDPQTYNMSARHLEEKINFYKKKNNNIKAVIVTDFAGQPADWKEILYLKKKYKFQLVNDNCHSIGSKYFGSISYAAEYADAASLSFHPVKHITTGEGGAIITNNKNIYLNAKLRRTHGIVKNFDKGKKTYPWLYDMKELGFNYRLSDIQSALGISQLKKLNKFVLKRRTIAKAYNSFFSNLDYVTIPKVKNNRTHSYHLYVLKINFKKIKIKKNKLFSIMKKNGINLQVHYIPVHTHSFYTRRFGFRKKEFPNSMNFYNEAISLPIYFKLKKKSLKKILNIFKKYLKK